MLEKRRGSPAAAQQAGKMPKALMLGAFLFLFLLLVGGSTSKTRAGLADHMVINEVSIQGSADAGGVNDDWVELYNPTSQAVNLTGWSIQKTTSSGGSLEKTALSGSIPATGYFLIVRNNASTTQSLKDAADVLASNDTFSLAANNIIYLVNDNDDIASTTNPTDPNIVDFVGLGSAVVYEGAVAALNPGAGKSIARIPPGEDTDQNSTDFQLQNNPTPTSSGLGDDDIGGTVLLTITPDAAPAQNITSIGAQIVFQVNATGTAQVKYGLDTAYASSTALQAVSANATTTISLTNLVCSTTYHYVIYAENTAATENDTTADATFTTSPCGITLDSLVMTKATAKANNQYADGWQWEFNITVWNLNEAALKMKFNQWSGAGALDAGGNMQYSVDSGANWRAVATNATYPAEALDISGIDNSAAAGRQVKITVQMKVPLGTTAGYYSSSYGILTE
jgi:hypothetical protein